MGAISSQHSPIDSTTLRCWCHHHLQWRSSLRSLQVQAVLRHLLSCLGAGRFLPRPGPDATEIWMACQFCCLDQPLDHVHYHGRRCTLSASVFSGRKLSRLQRKSRPCGCRCCRQLPTCHALCGPSRPVQFSCFYHRSDASCVLVRWSHAVHGIHVRDETPLRLFEGHVGGSNFYLCLLHALRFVHVCLPRPIPPKPVLPRNLPI